MEVLPDKAIREVADTDVEEYTVVRVVDEITVDLMARIGDVVFDNAESVTVVVNDVPIPIASLNTLIATKQGLRPKDMRDLRFLLRRQELETETGQGK